MISTIVAERAVLAGIAKYGYPAYAEVCDIIDCEDFDTVSNNVIYNCFKSALVNNNLEKVDLTTLMAKANELGVSSLFENTEDIDYIKSLYKTPIELENVRHHAVKIFKKKVANEIIAATQNVYNYIKGLTGDETINEILSIPESEILNIGNNLENGIEKPIKLLAKSEEFIQELLDSPKKSPGIPTGYPIYDKLIGDGLRPKFVNLIAARPGVGKSSFSVNVGLNIAKNEGIPVLYLDTEMTEELQAVRCIANLSDIHSHTIETGGFKDSIHEKIIKDTCRKYKDIPFYYKNIPGKGFSEVLSIIKRWILQEVDGPSVVIYDYFKLMSSEGLREMQEYQAMGFQISQLTDFCNINNVACLAMVQESRTEDVSQSDRLEWLASSVYFLKRKTPEEIAQDGHKAGNRKLVWKKSRFAAELPHGDYLNFYFDGNTFRLTELNTKSHYVQRNNGDNDSSSAESEST